MGKDINLVLTAMGKAENLMGKSVFHALDLEKKDALIAWAKEVINAKIVGEMEKLIAMNVIQLER
jgi:hypothetical protein